MIKISKIFYILITAILMYGFSAFGQTTTQKFQVDKIYKADSVIVTIKKTDTVFITIPADTARILALKCSTIVQPPVVTNIQSMYVVLDDVINDVDGFLKYCTDNNVNELNCYARTYLTTSTKRSTLSSFITKAHLKSIKINIDYRLTSELADWETYFTTYSNTIQRPDGMVTEREPYITGDYVGFYPFLLQGDNFAAKYNIGLYCYMGHPTQQAWDSIIVHCDRVYLSNYISMSVYNGANGQYRYVSGRWQYITNSAKKFNKINYPVVYIKSLEKKSWGAGNDFMGDAYINGIFYGSIMKQGIDQYESNATAEIKQYTDLIGDCIFHYKYGVLAIPRR